MPLFINIYKCMISLVNNNFRNLKKKRYTHLNYNLIISNYNIKSENCATHQTFI